MIAFCPIQTTRDNPDSWWSLNNIVGSVKIPTHLAESGYDIVWVSKYVYKVVSSVDGYVRVYTRRNTRIYKKIWSGFLLRGITYFPTYGNFVLEIQAKSGLRIVLGRCPVLCP